MRDHTNAVFYDASGKRRVRFWYVLAAVAFVFLFAVVIFVICLNAAPQFAPLLLSQAEPLTAVTTKPEVIPEDEDSSEENVPYSVERDEEYSGGRPIPATAAVKACDCNHALVFGFYVDWDPASRASLKLNIGHLTHLVPEWLFLQDAKGTIADETDEDVVRLARGAHVPILALVSNYRDDWRTAELHAALSKASTRHRLERNIRDRVVAHGFAGVNIDFERSQPSDHLLMTTFMRELHALMKPASLLVTQDIPVDDDPGAYDLNQLAEQNDYIVPLIYDQHFQSGLPGPVAAQWWFANELKKTLAEIPPSKTVIGIGNYGYDWVLGSRGGVEVGFRDVISAGISGNSPVKWDAETLNPVLHYERAGRQHEVWYLDAVTALNELRALSRAGVQGTALWRLGTEDPGIWKILKPDAWPSDNLTLKSLSQLDVQQSVILHGRGEIIRLAGSPRTGRRSLWRGGVEYSEEYDVSPSTYVVDTFGYRDDKTIALTFDDGPDPAYTPAILDILKVKQVPAAFFVVGSQVENSVDILRRMYAEGHIIGNHTYSHPDIATASSPRTHLELNMTQRLIEFSLGRSTTLFRPPYQAEIEPDTVEGLRPLEDAEADGYTVVGEKIDPRDWDTRSAAQIERIALQEKDFGTIMLLHDGGGNRAATVAALPRIIDDLRSQGYRFVSLTDLLGKSREELMPAPPREELRWARVEGGLLVAKSKISYFIGIIFGAVIGLTAVRLVGYGILSIIQKRRAGTRTYERQFAAPVSVIIAAYDEEKVILKTVRSILNNGYDAPFEIVVVNDGSKDGTLQLLNKTFENDKRLRILTQPNFGKAAALNLAIENTQHEILIALDADTIFKRGTMAKLVRHFSDPMVAAVSGNVRIGNKKNWLTRFQSLEYIYGFNLDRRALDSLNAMTVIPGAVGAWRKGRILECGGFSNDTVAEDTDLTLAIRRHGYEFRYDDEAIAYTEAPESIRDLVRQRLRWAFGTLQSAWKHRDATFNPKCGTMAFVTLPSIWLYQVVLAAISPVAEIAILLALLRGNAKIVLAYYSVFLLLELLTGLLAFSLEGENPFDLWILPLQRVFYPHLMLYVVGRAVVSAITGGLSGWTRARRRASVVEAVPSGWAVTERRESSTAEAD